MESGIGTQSLLTYSTWMDNFSFLLIKVTLTVTIEIKCIKVSQLPKFHLAVVYDCTCIGLSFLLAHLSVLALPRSLHLTTTTWPKSARNSTIGSIFKGLWCNYVQYTKFVKLNIDGLRPLLLFHSNLDLNIINLQIWNKSTAWQFQMHFGTECFKASLEIN